MDKIDSVSIGPSREAKCFEHLPSKRDKIRSKISTKLLAKILAVAGPHRSRLLVG